MRWQGDEIGVFGYCRPLRGFVESDKIPLPVVDNGLHEVTRCEVHLTFITTSRFLLIQSERSQNRLIVH